MTTFRELLKKPTVVMATAEDMRLVPPESVDLFIGASVHLPGSGPSWDDHAKLYDSVYNKQALRVVKPNGLFVVVQTNAYADGVFVDRRRHLANLLAPHWLLVDERIWARRKAHHFQPPFSSVLVYKRPGGAVTRRTLNTGGGSDWFDGVWHHTERRGAGENNGWPDDFSRTIIGTCCPVGGVVLDAFAGSGRPLAMAHHLGRKALGFEIDPDMRPVILGNRVRLYENEAYTDPPPKKGFAL